MNNLIALAVLTFFASSAFAADDPSIKGEIREHLETAMLEHVEIATIGDHYLIYDPVAGALKKLEFKKLHKGVVKKGPFYISCADFVDGDGRAYDLDFFVAKKGDKLHVLQALVHSIDGEKRAYHLETEKKK